jgi:hypothetical protein
MSSYEQQRRTGKLRRGSFAAAPGICLAPLSRWAALSQDSGAGAPSAALGGGGGGRRRRRRGVAPAWCHLTTCTAEMPTPVSCSLLYYINAPPCCCYCTLYYTTIFNFLVHCNKRQDGYISEIEVGSQFQILRH